MGVKRFNKLIRKWVLYFISHHAMETNDNEADWPKKIERNQVFQLNTINRRWLWWVLIGIAIQTCLTVRCPEGVVLCQRHLRPTWVEYFLPLFCSERWKNTTILYTSIFAFNFFCRYSALLQLKLSPCKTESEREKHARSFSLQSHNSYQIATTINGCLLVLHLKRQNKSVMCETHLLPRDLVIWQADSPEAKTILFFPLLLKAHPLFGMHNNN